MASPLRAFTIFSRLPIELRLKIWQFAFYQPRIVEFRMKPNTRQVTSIQSLHKKEKPVSDICWLTKCPPQAGLSICRESREEALKLWSLRFPLLAGGDGVIYLNMMLDTVFLSRAHSGDAILTLIGDIDSHDVTGCGMRFLAMDVHMVVNTWKTLRTILPIMAPSLEGLYLAIDDARGGRQSGERWVADCAFVAPKGSDEKLMCMMVGDPNLEAMRGFWKDRPVGPEVRIVATRRGEAARWSQDFVLKNPRGGNLSLIL